MPRRPTQESRIPSGPPLHDDWHATLTGSLCWIAVALEHEIPYLDVHPRVRMSSLRLKAVGPTIPKALEAMLIQLEARRAGLGDSSTVIFTFGMIDVSRPRAEQRARLERARDELRVAA